MVVEILQIDGDGADLIIYISIDSSDMCTGLMLQ